MGKVDSSGTSTYKRDGAGVLAPVLSDGTTAMTPGISSRASSTTTFDHHDYLGTTSLQTAANESTVSTRTYDAFGMPVSTSGTPKTGFGYAGRYGYQEDADSGLKLLGHRYYDSSTGRFLTRDPVGAGKNWFVYGNNNPTKWIDPVGLDADEVLRIIREAINKRLLPPGTSGQYKNDKGFSERIHDEIGRRKRGRGTGKDGRKNEDLSKDEIIDIVKDELGNNFVPHPVPPRPGGGPDWEAIGTGLLIGGLVIVGVAIIVMQPETAPAVIGGGSRLIQQLAGGR